MDVNNVEAVMKVVTEAVFTFLPVVDHDQRDAAMRAAALLDPDLAQALQTSSAQTGPGADWNSWVQQRAYVEAHAEISTQTHPADSDTAMRGVHVTQIVRTAEGPISQIGSDMAVSAIRTPGGWRISGFVPLLP